jgi:hypothetical protein
MIFGCKRCSMAMLADSIAVRRCTNCGLIFLDPTRKLRRLSHAESSAQERRMGHVHARAVDVRTAAEELFERLT